MITRVRHKQLRGQSLETRCVSSFALLLPNGEAPWVLPLAMIASLDAKGSQEGKSRNDTFWRLLAIRARTEHANPMIMRIAHEYFIVLK